MTMPYHHTQLGTLNLVVNLVIGALCAAIIWLTGTLSMAFMLVMVILVVVAILFCSLTVDVNGNELRWHFGPGFWTYRLALDEIQSVAIVRNHWWNGWGIRTAPGF